MVDKYFINCNYSICYLKLIDFVGIYLRDIKEFFLFFISVLYFFVIIFRFVSVGNFFGCFLKEG